MAVKLNSTGGGSVTLDSPSTASNYTVTLPSAAGTLATTTGTGSVFTNPTINGFTGDTSAITIGTTQFVKDTSGNIGIGVSPTSLLTTVSSGQVQIGTTAWPSSLAGKSNARTLIGNEGIVLLWNEAAAALGNAATIYIGPKGSGTNGSTIIAGGAISGVSESSSTNNGALTFSTNGGSGNTEKMRLDSSGNLGLGVTPSAWSSETKGLQIGAYGVNLSDAAGYQMALANNAYYNAGWKYKATGYAPALYAQGTSSHIWYNAPSGTAGNAITFTQAMTLDASGNLYVGTTNAVNYASRIRSWVPSGAISLETNSTTTANYYPSVFYNNTATAGYIFVSGTTTTFVSISDQREKTNIADAPNALASINAIKVRSFDWKSDGSHSEYGYIAQELLEVAPEAVHVPVDPEEMMGVDFGKLTPRLVKAIQELSAQNNALEARLAKLEAK